METLNVGMYIRTTDGIIDKVIIDYNGHCANPNCKHKHISCAKNYYDEDNVVKASYSIIDILEKGDYVNGSEILDFKYEFIEENDNFTNFAVVTENCYLENTDSWIIEKDIKSVITHEQIEQMAYKVGG